MTDKLDAPVTEDENFVNVDPDFANYSNEVDRPLPMEEVEDYNLPEWAREDKDKDEDEDKEEEEEPKTVTPTPATAAPQPAPAVKPTASK